MVFTWRIFDPNGMKVSKNTFVCYAPLFNERIKRLPDQTGTIEFEFFLQDDALDAFCFIDFLISTEWEFWNTHITPKIDEFRIKKRVTFNVTPELGRADVLVPATIFRCVMEFPQLWVEMKNTIEELTAEYGNRNNLRQFYYAFWEKNNWMTNFNHSWWDSYLGTSWNVIDFTKAKIPNSNSFFSDRTQWSIFKTFSPMLGHKIQRFDNNFEEVLKNLKGTING